MKFTPNSDSLAENKVLILYILAKIKKPLTNDDLYKIISVVYDMNYFYFQQFLFDLVESKYVLSFKKEDEVFYELTPEGENLLSLTSDILPGIILLNVDTKIKTVLDEIKEESSISTEFIPHSENDFTVICKIIENHKTVFEVTTYVGSREQAKAVTDNWKNNASKIYPKILELLSPKN